MGNCSGICNNKQYKDREFSLIQEEFHNQNQQIDQKDQWINENIQEDEMDEINDIKEKYCRTIKDSNRYQTQSSTLHYPNGDKYSGQTLSGLKHGYGILTYQDGRRCTIYSGNWINDKQQGHGKMIYANGNIYDGFWVDGQAEGFGKLSQKSGGWYEGEWKNNKYHGMGKEYIIKYSLYEGKFKEGQKQGKGKITYEDKSSYNGEFKADMIDGEGIYTWDVDRYYIGQWKNNKMDGQGLAVWPDGRRYEGEYVNGQKEGYGEYTWSDGRKYKGTWLAGLQHGSGFITDRNGVEKSCQFEQGKKVKQLQLKESDQNNNLNIG